MKVDINIHTPTHVYVFDIRDGVGLSFGDGQIDRSCAIYLRGAEAEGLHAKLTELLERQRRIKAALAEEPSCSAVIA